MNTLVEKGLGIIIFVGFFIPFAFGLYTSANAAYTFNNVTNELTQMIKEDGGIYKGSQADQYLFKPYHNTINNTQNTLVNIGYGATILTQITKAQYDSLKATKVDYLTTLANGSTTEYYYKAGKNTDITAKVSSNAINVDKILTGTDSTRSKEYLSVTVKKGTDTTTLYGNQSDFKTKLASAKADSKNTIKYFYYEIDATYGKVNAGSKIMIDYDYEHAQAFGWTPKYDKATVITSYKR